MVSVVQMIEEHGVPVQARSYMQPDCGGRVTCGARLPAVPATPSSPYRAGVKSGRVPMYTALKSSSQSDELPGPPGASTISQQQQSVTIHGTCRCFTKGMKQ